MRGFTALIGLISEIVELYKHLTAQKKEDTFRADIEAINDNTDTEWSKLAHKRLLIDGLDEEPSSSSSKLPSGNPNPTGGK